MNRLLRPICWFRMRFSWPYPISGHRYRELPEYEEGTLVYQPLECMTCGHIGVGWYEKTDPPGVL